METNEDEPLLTAAEVGKRVGVCTETVRRWIRGHSREGAHATRLPATNVGSLAHPDWRVSVLDLRRFLRARSDGARATQEPNTTNATL